MINPEDINLDEFRHSMPVQLRFNDIDILGHLNNTVYFSLYDLAKARFFEAVNRGVMNWRKVDCVIGNVNCTYIKQIRFGEEIEVWTRCLSIGDRSFVLRQCLVEAGTREIRSVCDTVMVCYDPATGKSAPMNPQWREALSAFDAPLSK